MKTIEICLQSNADSRFRFPDMPPIVIADGMRLEGNAGMNFLRPELEGRTVLCNIHGYNSDRRRAIRSYEIIEKRVATFGYDVALRVTWPAHTQLGFWLALKTADKAGRLLGGILAPMNCTRFDIQAHSLGSRVALVALPYLRNAGLAVLTAPAVDDESLGRGERYFDATGNCAQLLVCASRRDRVLGAIYRRAGSLLTNFWTWGDSALGYSGPQHFHKLRTNVEVLRAPEADNVDHSGWREYSPLYQRWRELVTIASLRHRGSL